MILAQWLLSGWSVAVIVADWHARRIPNGLLLAVCGGVVLYWGWAGEGVLGQTWRSSLIGFGLGVTVWLPGYLWGQVGAADVKLAACCGLVLGAYPTVVWLLLSSLLLGCVSIVVKVAPGLAQRLRQRDAQAGRVIPAGACMMPAFVAVMWWPAFAGSGLSG
ncbi:prepilin peptidase [Sinimarinibacterium sp. CAU 1509]|uniref:A24 family peptidase n=1 Tax=Sinimarinibacterium sp. CAU 1509 TaxID=2562283 RepID=UPI0010ACEC88|nr:A24 family peptidase [Sinimarinibacterium sp. CAU 1509]TJY56714.1 prepilin peptidase [Sinimarinibacterium sp. CAU 1509]